MSFRDARGGAATVIAVALVLGAVGFIFGASGAPDSEDAARERRAVYESALSKAEASAYRRHYKRGHRKGVERGRAQAVAASTVEEETPPPATGDGRAQSVNGGAGGASSESDSQGESGDSSGLVPCWYGGGLCTPEQNEAAGEEEAYCGPGQMTPDGRIVPKPGC